MTRRLVLKLEAESDIEDAFRWYEDKSIGLGHDFLSQLDSSFSFILERPDIHPIEHREVRRHLVRRFPYKVVYLLEDDTVYVLGVLHCGRRPSLMKDRMGKTR